MRIIKTGTFLPGCKRKGRNVWVKGTPIQRFRDILKQAGLKLDLERWKERSGMEELEMCRAWKELLEDAREEGKEEGEFEVIVQMLRRHKLSLEEIPEFFPKLNEEDIRKVERQALAETMV